MSGMKLGLIAIWLLAIASFFVAPGSPVTALGRAVFWILVVVHAIECVAFLPRLRAAGGSLARHLLQVFVFGFLHLREIDADASRA